MDSKWIKGSPDDTGFYVCEWTNMGGYAVFRIVNRDGVLFARDTETERGQRETRLDKWSISQHCRIPCPAVHLLNETFGANLTEGKDQRATENPDKRETDIERISAADGE